MTIAFLRFRVSGLCLLILLCLSCVEQDQSTVVNPTDIYTLNDDSRKFAVKVMVTNDVPKLDPNDEAVVRRYLKNLIPASGITHLSDLEVLFDTEHLRNGDELPVLTLVGMGVDQLGDNVPIAAEFWGVKALVKASSGGGGAATGGGGAGLETTHTCLGRQCTCCSFKRKEIWVGPILWERRIIGCNCDQGPANADCPGDEATCDHQISN